MKSLIGFLVVLSCFVSCVNAGDIKDIIATEDWGRFDSTDFLNYDEGVKINGDLDKALEKYLPRDVISNEYFYFHKMANGSAYGYRWHPKALKILLQNQKKTGRIQGDPVVTSTYSDLKIELAKIIFSPLPVQKSILARTKYDHFVHLFVVNNGNNKQIIVTESSAHEWLFEEDAFSAAIKHGFKVTLSNTPRIFDQWNCSMLGVQDIHEFEKPLVFGKMATVVGANSVLSSSGISALIVAKADLPWQLLKFSLNKDAAAQYLKDLATKNVVLSAAETVEFAEIQKRFVRDFNGKSRNIGVELTAQENLARAKLELLIRYKHFEQKITMLENGQIKAGELIDFIESNHIIPLVANAPNQAGVYAAMIPADLLRSSLELSQFIADRSYRLQLVDATDKNDLALLKQYSDLGVSLNVINNNGFYLREVAQYHFLSDVTFKPLCDFLEEKAKEKLNSKFRWEIVRAVGSNELDTVKSLLINGIDHNTKNWHGISLLNCAKIYSAQGQNFVAMENLLSSYSVQQNTNNSISPGVDAPYRWQLVDAVDKNDIKTARMLLNKGANPYTKNGKGVRLFDIAVYHIELGEDFLGMLDLITKFQIRYLDLPSNVTLTFWDNINDFYNLKLVTAVEANQVDLVKTWLDMGLNPQAINSHGFELMEIAKIHNAFNKGTYSEMVKAIGEHL